MLQSIGLAEYKENFTKRSVEGKELIAMQKQDFIVSSRAYFFLLTKMFTKLYFSHTQIFYWKTLKYILQI